MIARFTYLLIFCISAISSFFCMGQNEFSEGIDAYNKKEYGTAIEKFEQVTTTEPNNVSAWYNLGLSNIGMKEYGDAIWSFEKVLKLAPNDSEAAQKISHCYSELYTDRIWEPRLNSVESSLYSLSTTTWSMISIGLSCVLALLLIFRSRQNHRSIRNTFTLISVVFGALTIGSIVVAMNTHNYISSSNFAVVTKTSIPTFIEEGKTAKTSLLEGTRVELIEIKENDFVEVLTDQQETHLVNKKDLAII